MDEWGRATRARALTPGPRVAKWGEMSAWPVLLGFLQGRRIRTVAWESGTQALLDRRPGVTLHPWISTSSPVKWGQCWASGIAGLPCSCCLTSYPPVKDACPNSWRARGLLPRRGMPVFSPPPGSPPLPSSRTQWNPEAAWSPYAWCGVPDPPSCTLSILGFWRPSQLPHLSHCFSSPLPPAPLPLSTLTHWPSPGFCPWPSSLPILWPSCSLMVQTNFTSVFKAQAFFPPELQIL